MMQPPINCQGNKINPNKLLLSKWTAAKPEHKEKHFLVTLLARDEQNRVTVCKLQAVLTGNDYEIEWRQLKNSSLWLTGWR